jgi:hypothetical protein
MVGLELSSSRASMAELTSNRQTDFAFAICRGHSVSMAEITALYHSINRESESTNCVTLAAGLGF